MARLGLRWRKEHRYWFGARRGGAGWVMVTVLFDTTDIPRRAADGER